MDVLATKLGAMGAGLGVVGGLVSFGFKLFGPEPTNYAKLNNKLIKESIKLSKAILTTT